MASTESPTRRRPGKPPGRSPTLAEKDVSGALARDGPRAFIAQRLQVDSIQEMLSRTQHDRSNRQVQLVDEAGPQVLANGGHAAAEPHVASARCFDRLLQRGVNALGHEPKLRASRHPERRPRVMRQDEDWGVIGRLIAPPPLPTLVQPRAPDGTEHVAPENPGSDSVEALLRDPVVDARLSSGLPVHLPPEARWEEPLHELRAVDAERVLAVLARPGAETVDGDGEALHLES